MKHRGSGTEPQGEVALGAGISPAQARSRAHRFYLRILLLGTGLSALPSRVPAPGGTAPSDPEPFPVLVPPRCCLDALPARSGQGSQLCPGPQPGFRAPHSPFSPQISAPARLWLTSSPLHVPPGAAGKPAASLWAFCRVCPALIPLIGPGPASHRSRTLCHPSRALFASSDDPTTSPTFPALLPPVSCPG